MREPEGATSDRCAVLATTGKMDGGLSLRAEVVAALRILRKQWQTGLTAPREWMGIEPTRRRANDASTALKAAGPTRRPDTPRK